MADSSTCGQLLSSRGKEKEKDQGPYGEPFPKKESFLCVL